MTPTGRSLLACLGVWLAALATTASAASQASRMGLSGRKLAVAAKPAAPPADIEGIDVQVVLNPTTYDRVGSRVMSQVADDIRLEVSDGSKRKEGLQRFLAAAGLDPMVNLPLPGVFTGVKTRRVTTTMAETTPWMGVTEVTTRTTSTTPWPNIPASKLVPLNEAAMTTTTMMSMRLMIGTPQTTTAAVISTPGREGWMAIPPSAYSVEAPQVYPMRKEQGPGGATLECTGALCRQASGDSGVVLYPK